MDNWAKQIEDDLEWRESELISIKAQLIKTAIKSPKYQAFLRAMVLLLYAHYEGFCKFAWDLYFDCIQKAKVKRYQCSETIIKLSLRKEFKELGGNLSTDNIWDFFNNKLPNLMNQEIEFNITLETDSNLWPNLLKDNSQSAGLSCEMVDYHKVLLKTLVRRRNNIAHGQRDIIKNLAEYETYETAVFETIYELGLSVIESLEERRYLLNNMDTTQINNI